MEGVDFDGGLGGRRRHVLRTLVCGTESTRGTSIATEGVLVLALELVLNARRDGCRSPRCRPEDTFLDSKEREVE